MFFAERFDSDLTAVSEMYGESSGCGISVVQNSFCWFRMN